MGKDVPCKARAVEAARRVAAKDVGHADVAVGRRYEAVANDVVARNVSGFGIFAVVTAGILRFQGGCCFFSLFCPFCFVPR